MVTLRLPPSSAPLHERIAAAVRRAVAEDELTAGASLPAARELADALDVNVNTVLRAYRALRDEGTIDLRRGRGATVRATAGGRARLLALVDDVLAEAERVGLTPQELSLLMEERA